MKKVFFGVLIVAVCFVGSACFADEKKSESVEECCVRAVTVEKSVERIGINRLHRFSCVGGVCARMIDVPTVKKTVERTGRRILLPRRRIIFFRVLR